MTSEREIILESLILILEKGEFSHTVVSGVLNKYDYLKQNEKAFIKRITEGVIENVPLIDDIIDRYASVKTVKQKIPVRNILRMGVYQILFTDKIPESAAINESVKLAKKKGFGSLGGFVNGVLRSIARDKDKLISSLDESLNMPEWIREHLVKNYGEEKAELIIKDALREHPTVLRDRAYFIKDISSEERENYDTRVVKSGILPFAFYLKKGTSLQDIAGFNGGRYMAQDIASQMAVMCAGIKKGDLVLDVCAAPGGKALHAYDMGAIVIARDISEKKILRINDNIKRCKKYEADMLKENTGSIRAEVFDALTFDETMEEKADIVLADLPCSGLGVMGRKSDIKLKTQKEDLESLAKLQRDILDVVWKYVKKGGILLYSTCTLNPAENEEQVKYITDNYPFELYPYEGYLNKGMRQLFPGIDETDGFFIARLKRYE